MRKFKSGATRDSDTNKFDYDGFLSPAVVERYAQYMNAHRLQKDGSVRDSANWQRGIPRAVYMKSAWRHFVDWWKFQHGLSIADSIEDVLCAVIFNASGYLFEVLKKRDRKARKPPASTSDRKEPAP